MSIFDSDYSPNNIYFFAAMSIVIILVYLWHLLRDARKPSPVPYESQPEPLVPLDIPMPGMFFPEPRKEGFAMIERFFPKRVSYPWTMKHCVNPHCDNHYWTIRYLCPECGSILNPEQIVASRYPLAISYKAGKSFDGLKGELEDELQHQLTIEEVGDILTAECALDTVYEREEAKVWLEMRRKFLAGTWTEYQEVQS